jgi:hypothetical protein
MRPEHLAADQQQQAANATEQRQEERPAVSRHAEGDHARPIPHVFAVTLVKAACFYGYNPLEEPFLRVCLCDPPS